MSLGSGDVSAIGTNGQYSIELASPLVLDDNSDWEIGLIQASFFHPGNWYSVFITVNICANSRIGSFLAPVLFRCPPESTAAPVRVKQDSLPVYVPITTKNINSITVSFTYSLGTVIPPSPQPASNFSTIDVLIRRVLQ